MKKVQTRSDSESVSPTDVKIVAFKIQITIFLIIVNED